MRMALTSDSQSALNLLSLSLAIAPELLFPTGTVPKELLVVIIQQLPNVQFIMLLRMSLALATTSSRTVLSLSLPEYGLALGLTSTGAILALSFRCSKYEWASRNSCNLIDFEASQAILCSEFGEPDCQRHLVSLTHANAGDGWG